jgi:hypothetical protein
MAAEARANDPLILIDVEAHLFPSLKHISYFPGM